MMDFATVEKVKIMADEKRLIDADALIKEANEEGAYGYVDAKQIADAPTVDAVEVVRCRDCKHYDGKWLCKISGVPSRKPCDFCSHGERKDGDVDG